MAAKKRKFHKKFNIVVIVLTYVIGFALFGFCESPDLRGLSPDKDRTKLLTYTYFGFGFIIFATILLTYVLFKTMEGKKSLKKRAIKTVAKNKEAFHPYKSLKIKGLIFFIAAYTLIVPGTFFTFRFAVTNPDYYVYTLLGEIAGFVFFVIGYFQMGTRANIIFCDLTGDFIEMKEDLIVFKMPWPKDAIFSHSLKAAPFYFLGLKEFDEQTLLAHNLGYDIFAEYNLGESRFTYKSNLSELERSLQKDRMDRLATGDMSVLDEMPSYYRSTGSFYEIDYDFNHLGKTIEKEVPVYEDVAVEDVYHYEDDQLVRISSNYESRQVGTRIERLEYCHVKVAIIYKANKKVVKDLKGNALRYEGNAFI